MEVGGRSCVKGGPEGSPMGAHGPPSCMAELAPQRFSRSGAEVKGDAWGCLGPVFSLSRADREDELANARQRGCRLAAQMWADFGAYKRRTSDV